MKFNIKFLTFRKLYIHFCFLALLNIFFSTANVNAKSFSINDIEISTPFEINFNKNQIIDERDNNRGTHAGSNDGYWISNALY